MKLRHPDGRSSGQLDSPTLTRRLVLGDEGRILGGKALERYTCPKMPREPHLGTFLAQVWVYRARLMPGIIPSSRVWVGPVTCYEPTEKITGMPVP